MTWEYTIRLPHGPSVNEYYRKDFRTGTQHITKKGRLYRNTLIWLVRASDRSVLPLLGDLQVEVQVMARDRRWRHDLDNYWKALLDAGTHAGIWGDDRQIEDERIYRTYDKSIEPYLEVRVRRIE